VLANQFQQDTQRLVIAPVEKMVNIIKQLAVEPLKKPEPTVTEEDEFGKPTKKGGPQLETAMLEHTIMKIGSLLQLGFGASGADVLGANMSSGDGELNIMMPGLRVYSIFAYVDIRESACIAEAMDDDVLTYINLIADIVQTCVIHWGGVPMKTLGDAFVLLWRADRQLQEMEQSKSSNNAGLGSISADKALLSIIKIYCEIRRSEGVTEILDSPLAKEIGLAEVDMGYSLHAGWAIEGPVGSDYKVDAAYLSSDVSLTHFFENTTKLYGVTFILSEKIYMMFSLNAKDRCRRIDSVKIGDTQIGLYTFDIGPNFELDLAPKGHKVAQLVRPEDFTDIAVDTLEQEAAAYLFAMDRDVTLLQATIPEQLATDYRQGLSSMAAGEWTEAKNIFEQILEYCDDGPSKAQLKMMAIDPDPESWQGYHVLDNDFIAMMSMVKELKVGGHGASIEGSGFAPSVYSPSSPKSPRSSSG
jgi:hypothetical protein